MKELRRRFDRFCFRNRDKGIRDLMMYVGIGCAIMMVFDMIDPSGMLYYWLCFDRSLILRGQIWRLLTFIFCYSSSNPLLTAISLICYYSLGRAMENVWGTFRFNIYYLTGVLMMDIYCMVFGGAASAAFLNLSLFLAYATMYPDSQFLLLFIIPVKAWIFALLYLLMAALQLFGSFPYNLFPLIAFANYFLFFGKDVVNLLPMAWRVNAKRAAKKAAKPKTVPFNNAGSYQATHTTVKRPYNHQCTVCGRNDVTNPELEFRYCSRCKGYHCYCQDHINDHTHVQ